MPPLLPLKTYPFSGSENPTADPRYYRTLRLLPTLRERAIAVLNEKARRSASKNVILSDNSGVIPDWKLEIAKELLREMLEYARELLKHPPIIFVKDPCFTNTLLESSLRKMIGSGYDRYVDTINFDYSKPEQSPAPEAFHKDSIVLLWGSFSDAYDVDQKLYQSPLAKIVQDAVGEFPTEHTNRRLLSVCFGQQFTANVMGMMRNDRSSVIATIKWPAQFGPFPCRICDLNFVPSIYRSALRGISNEGKSLNFTVQYTRTGHVDFDVLSNSQNEQKPIIPLISDVLTGETVGWWTYNGKVLAVQFHPEIPMAAWQNAGIVRKISEIASFLKDSYGPEISEIVGGVVKNSTYIKRDVSEAFYVFSLLAFLESILLEANLQQTVEAPKADDENEAVGYDEVIDILLSVTRGRVREILKNVTSDGGRFHPDGHAETLEKLDRFTKKFRLLTQLDWKVSRGISEVSEVLGLNLSAFLEECICNSEKNRNGACFVFRDWGAGDGTLIRELYKRFKGKDVVFYGVGDVVYFDLYHELRNAREVTTKIPDEILMLFTQKVISECLKDPSYSERPTGACVREAIGRITWSTEDTITRSSMFSAVTHMFPNEGNIPLSEAAKNFLIKNPKELEWLSAYVSENFYSLSKGFYERIYLAEFSSFELQKTPISKVDFQTAVRSTSHVDGPEYEKILVEYLKNASEGSVLVENGVHRSYTSIPRIPEIARAVRRFPNDVSVTFLFDRKTNYFCSAVISKAPFRNEENLKSHLNDGVVPVSLEEALSCTFFRFEYFVRNFLIACFRGNEVFFQFNKEIVAMIKTFDSTFSQRGGEGVKNEIVALVNRIVERLNQQGKIQYGEIDPAILAEYRGIDNVGIDDILNDPFVTYDWFNTHSERKY